jgi:hypothetical protein
MEVSSSSFVRASAPAIITRILGLCLLMAVCDARAATLVTGSVTDSSTGTAIAGAQVEIAKGAVRLGQAVSGSDGRFRLSIDVPNTPQAQNLKLTVRHSGHVDAASDVVVVSGRPDRAAYAFDLLPSAVADCRRGSNHVVVVGYFRPPASQAGDTGLADRVKDTLDYDLLAPMQLVGVPTGMQPTILACGNVQPRAATDYPALARALGADAFLAGYVTAPASPTNPKVKVEMVIADRHGVLQPPARASSPDVDLDDPAAARLSAAAHVAILTALVAGYEKAGQSAECVEVTNAAERVVGTLPPGLAQARERCTQKLPNRALLRNSP